MFLETDIDEFLGDSLVQEAIKQVFEQFLSLKASFQGFVPFIASLFVDVCFLVSWHVLII
jgi:hypothetical protein